MSPIFTYFQRRLFALMVISSGIFVSGSFELVFAQDKTVFSVTPPALWSVVSRFDEVIPNPGRLNANLGPAVLFVIQGMDPANLQTQRLVLVRKIEGNYFAETIPLKGYATSPTYVYYSGPQSGSAGLDNSQGGQGGNEGFGAAMFLRNRDIEPKFSGQSSQQFVDLSGAPVYGSSQSADSWMLFGNGSLERSPGYSFTITPGPSFSGSTEDANSNVSTYQHPEKVETLTLSYQRVVATGLEAYLPEIQSRFIASKVEVTDLWKLSEIYNVGRFFNGHAAKEFISPEGLRFYRGSLLAGTRDLRYHDSGLFGPGSALGLTSRKACGDLTKEVDSQ